MYQRPPEVEESGGGRRHRPSVWGLPPTVVPVCGGGGGGALRGVGPDVPVDPAAAEGPRMAPLAQPQLLALGVRPGARPRSLPKPIQLIPLGRFSPLALALVGLVGLCGLVGIVLPIRAGKAGLLLHRDFARSWPPLYSPS